MARRNDKRERLVDAADQLFHQQGVSTTTLANIATLADVPLGNVYYYFKSKDSITLAVIDRRKRKLNNLFTEWNTREDVKSRLQGLIEYVASLAEESAQFGDSLGSLCQELGKQGGAISAAAAGLMNEMIHWCEKQFKSLGKSEDDSAKLALNLVSSLQGISLITLAFKDPDFVNRQGQFLTQWVQMI
ncbi:TetR/AcrR family transcriptional regulator [Candidatus Berkiella cookevillensis]|uniref:HTH-type transcriptional repressor NemR n=1 Tax=Candidatus Berkiella cookevillensis TaxID=437022 RepID=A0A0Q9YFE8_9GAMM|nr:TetR/AcrR family transcriptional regulator [Candidatus Berkiella cookevillensis]MCS5708852.1 TetR/AcrR family transcriptional regulator [Candidatus Berkiella cookevillensis]